VRNVVADKTAAVTPVDDPPRMRRRRTGRVVAGVAGGLADHLSVSVLWVRLALTVLSAFAGAGLALYALLWVFVRQEPVGAPVRQTPARERQQSLALIALGASLLLAASTLSGTVTTWVTVPLGVALIGAAVVWREADEAQRRRWMSGARTGMVGGGGRTALVRLLSGAVLVAVGIGVLLLHSVSLSQLPFALLAVLATLIGVAVLTVPWWLRLVRDLSDERRARIRGEERAEIAAHLHDSVLQTLALIQKQAETPREVLRLARGQERQLRTWLYGPSGYGKVTAGIGAEAEGAPSTVAEALAQAGGEVEDTFAVAVRPVVVGDAPMDAGANALVQATREAMVNAAKHSGESEISVYAEVEPERVTVFVRDRGKGFDPDAVSEDRHGLDDSIRGRMDRHGGTVKLRTAIGAGTEVQLCMPRAEAGAKTTGAKEAS
jgi:signal transduction histidine kinase